MCFGDGTSSKLQIREQSKYRSQHKRYGAAQSYYPAHYYSRAPLGPFANNHHHHALRHGHHGYGHLHHHHGHVGHGHSHSHGLAPRHAIVPAGAEYGSYGYHAGGRALMPSTNALLPSGSFAMDNLGQPKPRHQYILYPQPGRRGILVHNGQYANGAPYVGSTSGMGMGMGMGMMGYGGMGMEYPGVNAHISPLYYGPNVARSTYSNYAGFMGGYTGLNHGLASYPTYSYSYPYLSPFAYGYGSGMYANYYHPYQRTYYGMNPVMAGGAYSYSYPGVASTVIPPSTTTFTTVTNSHVPVPVAPVSTTTSTTTVRPHIHSPQIHTSPPMTRNDVQYQNRIVATERGAYNPRRIKPEDARPDDPFWCKERTGEWHLRTYYQIENECYPGVWVMDATQGFLCFHRQ